MAISQSMCTSFKAEILLAVHDFRSTGGDTFKLAMYTSSATIDANSTAYSATNEVSSSGTNYTAGGLTLTITQVPTFTSTTAWLDFDDVTFSSATITSNGALIYNVTQSNKAVAVLAFGGDKTSTAGNFTIQFPAATSTTAILRIA